LCVVSSGWKVTHALIKELLFQDILLMSEIDLAWRVKEDINPEQKWIGITGTNGKTTTVELTTAILKEAGLKVAACGNVGDTVIDAVTDSQRFDYLVVELSSFQLEWSKLPEYSACAILNIADDHTDWHGGFENYIQAKLRILNSTRCAVLNRDDKIVMAHTSNWSGNKVLFTISSPQAGEVGVVEDLLVDRAFIKDPSEAKVLAELKDVAPQAAHAVSNTLAASALARATGVDHLTIQSAIRNFRPGRHRIETVVESGGIAWINDSKATNPHAAAASLRSFSSLIWIAGGMAKGAKMADLVHEISSKLKAVILIGEDRELIAQEVTRFAPLVPLLRIDGDKSDPQGLMSRVVIAAQQVATSGDTVLLAPACASMDQFSNYASRGDLFRDAVLALVAHK